jgi:hypothetical protein
MTGSLVLVVFLCLDLAAVVIALARLSRHRATSDMTDVRYRNARRLFRD